MNKILITTTTTGKIMIAKEMSADSDENDKKVFAKLFLKKEEI